VDGVSRQQTILCLACAGASCGSGQARGGKDAESEDGSAAHVPQCSRTASFGHSILHGVESGAMNDLRWRFVRQRERRWLRPANSPKAMQRILRIN